MEAIEAINDASKYVARCHKLIEDYLEKNNIENEALLLAARDLMAKTMDVLSKVM